MFLIFDILAAVGRSFLGGGERSREGELDLERRRGATAEAIDKTDPRRRFLMDSRKRGTARYWVRGQAQGEKLSGDCPSRVGFRTEQRVGFRMGEI